MNQPLHLFAGYGIEIEYMIVDRQSCRVRPVAELLLKDKNGEVANEVDHGPLSWSNELVRHVIELKTNGPAASLAGLGRTFQEDIRRVNTILAAHNCMLLPTATHPFMDPATETTIWEHENTEIYQAFNAIFDCRGHGWSNLQSMHINLPFATDEEFFRLHNAIRLLLPLIPAISSASPFQDGRDSGFCDSRLVHYAQNCARIPQVTGLIVPEPIATPAEYQSTILTPIYEALKPYDPKAILQEEWANARGAIARFDRNAIEIRVIDSQECPAADLAIAEIVCSAVRYQTEQDRAHQAAMHRIGTATLHQQLQQCIKLAETAKISDPELRSLLRLPDQIQTCGRFWHHYAETCDDLSPESRDCLDTIFREGSLAGRMRRGVETVDGKSLQRLCFDLAACLASGEMYHPNPPC